MSDVRDRPTSTLDAPTLVALTRALPPEVVITDPDVVGSYAHDESRFTARYQPGAVLFPRSTEEVAQCLRATQALGLTVVVRGAGTGLSGAANAPDGAVVLSTRRLDRILHIDPVDRIAVVQPGVVTAALRAAATEHRLLYPPDPGSVEMSTIGGNVATNAGGMCCVKYGVTADFVIALEVVLADGRIMRTGRRTVKGVAGYDLTHVFVGSEGTLGVVTEITVRLVAAPADPTTLLATFHDLRSAGGAVQALLATGHTPSVLELLDHTTLQAIEAVTPLGFDDSVAVALLVQSDTVTADADVARFAEACATAGAVDTAVSSDPAESTMLMQARRSALPALERLGDWLLDDVCVPRSRIVDLLVGIETIASDEGVKIGVFGHAGDGNMHPTVIYDDADPDSRAAASRAFDRITALTLELGGTITGEHGVGRLKARWLTAELDPVARQVHLAVRRALDPKELLNPGAVLDVEETPCAP